MPRRTLLSRRCRVCRGRRRAPRSGLGCVRPAASPPRCWAASWLTSSTACCRGERGRGAAVHKEGWEGARPEPRGSSSPGAARPAAPSPPAAQRGGRRLRGRQGSLLRGSEPLPPRRGEGGRWPAPPGGGVGVPCRAPQPRQPRAGPPPPAWHGRPPAPLAAKRAAGSFHLHTLAEPV